MRNLLEECENACSRNVIDEDWIVHVGRVLGYVVSDSWRLD